MAFEITRRPYDWSFSGNPIHYELYSDLAVADAAIYFEVKLLFKNVADVAFAEVVTLPYYPVAGTAKIDLKDILDGLLEFELPQFDVDETLFWAAPKQTGKYYIEFRQITPSSSDPSWDTSESAFTKFIVKGGIDYFKYRGNNFWLNYFKKENNDIAFMTWQKNGRLAALDERMYLGFLNTYENGSNTLKTQVTVYYTDGSETLTIIENGLAEKGVMYYFPAGATQLGLQNLIPDKTIYKWDVWILKLDGINYDALSERFFFEADNRNNYNDETLYYRGSLGGLDSMRVRGVIEHNLNYKNDAVEEITEPDYFDGHFVKGQTTIEGNREKKVWRGNVGYMPKEDQDRLRDAKLKTEAWKVIGEKWLPLNIIVGEWRQKTTEDTVWAMPIEYSLAKDGDNYYTPDSVDLGDGVFNDNVCRAMIGSVEISKEEDTPTVGTATVTIDFTETDPQDASTQFTYQILGVHANPVTANYGDLPLSFELPMEEDYVIEFFPICVGGVIGKKTSQGFNTNTGDGGGGDPDCSVENYTSNEGNYTLKIDGVDIHLHFLGALGIDHFNLADGGPQQYRVVLSFYPSMAKLITDGGTEYTGAIAANQVTWSNITTVGGFIIKLY